MLAGLLLLSALLAPAAPSATARKPITADDLWALERVGSPVVSPDGTRVVYTVSRYEADDDRMNADLWLFELASGTSRRLTTNKASDTSPAFSPDGKRLVFVSKREGDKVNQLYVMPLEGGEAERVTDVPLNASSPKWLPDGQRIVFVSGVVAGSESPEATKKVLETREKSKVKAKVSESRLYRFWDRWLTDDEFPHLFVLDIKTRKTTDVLPASTRLFNLSEEAGASYDVSPDGAWIVFAANATGAPYNTLNDDLFLVPTSGGEPKDLTADNLAGDASPVFSPDGRTIAFTRSLRADGWPDRSRLALLDVATGKVTVLTQDMDASASQPAFTRDGRSLIFSADVRGRANLYTVPVSGGAPKEIVHGGSAGGAADAGGEIVFTSHGLSRPTELASVRADGGGLRTLTHVNDERMAALDLGKVDDLVFKGADGDDVQMFVVYPPGFDPAKKWPLVQLVHGGPVGTFGDAWGTRWNPHVFAAAGYVVAMINFHGSSSFGQKWVESILGAHPDKPFTDVMKGTDFLIAKGYIDPGRMAAAGGSYGGFLVNWIEGHTDRFKCLVSHAGVYSLLGQFASDSTFGRQHSYGGYPYTNLANIEKWSPNRYSASFKTPMLVTHGERDFRVPIDQGLELYGVLTAKGVPARLVYYPDEHHWVLKGANSKHWYGEVQGWLARWLK